MNIIPFGIVRDERIEISKRYKLIEYVNGIWRLTETFNIYILKV